MPRQPLRDMQLAVAILLAASASTPQVEGGSPPAGREARAVATATASARIMAAETVDFEDDRATASAATPRQRNRDASGTIWIEFS